VIFLFAITYFDELAEAFQDLSDVASNVVESEKNLSEQLKQREEILAEIDGIELSEEEVDNTVSMLMTSSPNRIKLNRQLDKLHVKMRG
jgi:chaperonin cofactor prefoldin